MAGPLRLPCAGRNIAARRSFTAAMAGLVSEGLREALEAERRIEPRSDAGPPGKRCSRMLAAARAAISTNARPRPFSAQARSMRRWSSSASSPGDQEDLPGVPFVGPAGRCSTLRWRKPGSIARRVYVTNAVKHFKIVLRGKRRIHNKPDAVKIEACRWWIEHERELIRPPVTMALGATAARSLLGRVVTISKVRGEPLTLADGSECWVTAHPSSILRAPDEETRREGKRLFLRDLKLIKARADELAS